MTIEHPSGQTETVPATCDGNSCSAQGTFHTKDHVYVEQGGIVDSYGETNGERSEEVEYAPGTPSENAPRQRPAGRLCSRRL